MEYIVFMVDPMDEMTAQYEEAFGSGLIVPKKSGVISGAPMPGLKLTDQEFIMAKGKSGHDPSIANRVKIGKPRTSKIFRKKGNAASSTSKRGNGARVR